MYRCRGGGGGVSAGPDSHWFVPNMLRLQETKLSTLYKTEVQYIQY